MKEEKGGGRQTGNVSWWCCWWQWWQNAAVDGGFAVVLLPSDVAMHWKLLGRCFFFFFPLWFSFVFFYSSLFLCFPSLLFFFPLFSSLPFLYSPYFYSFSFLLCFSLFALFFFPVFSLSFYLWTSPSISLFFSSPLLKKFPLSFLWSPFDFFVPLSSISSFKKCHILYLPRFLLVFLSARGEGATLPYPIMAQGKVAWGRLCIASPKPLAGHSSPLFFIIMTRHMGVWVRVFRQVEGRERVKQVLQRRGRKTFFPCFLCVREEEET